MARDRAPRKRRKPSGQAHVIRGIDACLYAFSTRPMPPDALVLGPSREASNGPR